MIEIQWGLVQHSGDGPKSNCWMLHNSRHGLITSPKWSSKTWHESISLKRSPIQLVTIYLLNEDGVFYSFTIMLQMVKLSSFLESEWLDLLVSSVKVTIVLELYRRKWQGGNMNTRLLNLGIQMSLVFRLLVFGSQQIGGNSPPPLLSIYFLTNFHCWKCLFFAHRIGHWNIILTHFLIQLGLCACQRAKDWTLFGDEGSPWKDPWQVFTSNLKINKTSLKHVSKLFHKTGFQQMSGKVTVKV